MTIVNPIQPAWILEERGETLRVRFITSRYGTLSALLWGSAITALPLVLAIRLGASGMWISVVVGGTFSLIFQYCFVAFPLLCRTELTVEPELVRVQRTIFQIPVGEPKIYPRNAITDLDVHFNAHGHIAQSCRVSFWISGRSVELEREFPVRQLEKFKTELIKCGIVFPVTLSDSARP